MIGQVARALTERVSGGMARDDRAEFEAREIPEPGLVEMADVDEDPELRAASDQSTARSREARARVGRRRRDERDPECERVGAAPDRPERAQSGRVPQLERLKLRVD